MASFFRTCLDGHRCENGSSCREHPLSEGTYFCDCETSNGDFAGLFCEYEAQTYCQLPEETESTWFCANEGTCALATNPSQWRCDCPSDYEGPHCQFIKGNVPRDWPGFDFDPSTATSSSSSSGGRGKNEDGVETGIMVAIVLVAAILVGLLAYVVVRTRRNRGKPSAAQNTTRDPAEALKLDADGSVLQEVMASMSRTPDLTASAAGTYDFETADGTGSVEITEPYSDRPRKEGSHHNGGSNGNIPRSSTNSTNGSYNPTVL